MKSGFTTSGKRLYLLVLFCLIHSFALAQNPRYFIQFTDKANSPYSVNRPQEFLSGRAIERRQKQRIVITVRDLPVNPAYLEAIRSAGARVWYPSRWMNGALVEGDAAAMSRVRTLPFVKPESAAETVSQALPSESPKPNVRQAQSFSQEGQTTETAVPAYGPSGTQLNMLGVDKMHRQGYTGRGMQIAVLDGGFRNADRLPFFSHLFAEGRILGTYDFVDREESVYENEAHGMQVLSAIAALQPGALVGPAYEAGFWLLRTEDSRSEHRIEEVNWLIGAEFADSAGVDIINSSLGYNIFDNPASDYRPRDMNGQIAFSTRAADMAAATGILVVTSAGNEGNDAWRTITAPADGDSVLAVGAVDQGGLLAPFSSVGPSADRRIKPELAAMGRGTVLGRPDGSTGTSNGTSFSAPLITGLAAGLWQAFPELTNMEVISYLQRSATQANRPDSLLGYGIPDFARAYELAYRERKPNQSLGYFSPNPVVGEDIVTLWVNVQALGQPLTLQWFDASGRAVAEQRIATPALQNRISIPPAALPRGLYLIRLTSPGRQNTVKLIRL